MSEIVASGIIRADKLRKYVEVLGAFVQECKIHFNDDGLRTVVVDPANVAMYRPASLSSHAFESVDCPGSVTLGVNLNKVEERLDSAQSDALVHVKVDMETRKLILKYDEFTHRVQLIDPETIRKEPNTPDLDLPNYLELQSDRLDDVVENADYVTDYLIVQGDESTETCTFYGEGDTDDFDAKYRDDDDCVTRIEMTDNVESMFSLDYFKDVVGVIPDGVDVGIQFGEEHPTVWEWSAFDDDLNVTTMIAPRIQKQ